MASTAGENASFCWRRLALGSSLDWSAYHRALLALRSSQASQFSCTGQTGRKPEGLNRTLCSLLSVSTISSVWRANGKARAFAYDIFPPRTSPATTQWVLETTAPRFPHTVRAYDTTAAMSWSFKVAPNGGHPQRSRQRRDHQCERPQSHQEPFTLDRVTHERESNAQPRRKAFR